jgi:predicted ATPase
LGLSFHAGREPRQQLLDHLREKAVLLILDSFEHLLEGVGLVAEILRAAPAVRILVTSRARLNVEGESLYPVAGMKFPGQEALYDAIQYSAVKLFLQSARRTRPDFALRDDNQPDVVRICRLVNGLPLGVLLAAAWVGVLTPAEIADQISGQIGRSLDFLATDLSEVPERMRSMRAVFDHSWRLLTEREREVVRALSVLRGDFTREAAERVAGASLRELKGLADKSMVQRTPTPSGPLRARRRYEVHNLLRQYAAEKLAHRPGAWERAHDRHSAYYTAALQRWREEMAGGPQQRRGLAEIEADIENARAAWNWAVEHRQVTRLERAAHSLFQFYVWRARSEELESAGRLAVEGLTPAESPEEQRVLAQVLAWQGSFLPNELDFPLLRQSLALLEGLESGGHDIRQEKALVLHRLGCLARAQGLLQQSEQLLQQSLTLFRALGDSEMIAETLEDLGWVGWMMGKPMSARRTSEESLAIRESLGDMLHILWSLLNLGYAALLQGRLEEAERTHRESLARCREMDVPIPYEARNALAATLSALGRFTEAGVQWEEALAICAEVGLPTAVGWMNCRLGLLAEMHLGWYEEAHARGQASLRTGRERDHRAIIGRSHLLLGCVALVRQEDDEALGLLREGVTACRESGQQHQLSLGLAALGMATIGQGNRLEAAQVLGEALQIVAETHSYLALGWVIPGVVALLLEQGERERAVELYAMACSRYPFVKESRWFEDVIGRQVAAAAADLPPAGVEAAEARGRGRDQAETVAELLAELS